VFRQLLKELGIPERIKLPAATNKLAALSQKLSAEVGTSEALPMVTSTSGADATGSTPPRPPAEGPQGAPPSPGPTATAVSGTVKELEQVATEAVRNNQLDVAVAAQQQLKEAVNQVTTKFRSNRNFSGLASDLQRSQENVEKAIQAKGAKGRVYIHIADESQRETARNIGQLISQNHFAVVGIQNVGGRAYIPDTAEVRFFTYPEAKEPAEEITRILKGAGVSQPRSSYVAPSENDRKASIDIKTHFEIWFARDSFLKKQ
jgi:hypothetical protein